jgi:hypothetical protein
MFRLSCPSSFDRRNNRLVKKHKLRISSLRNFLHPSVTFSFIFQICWPIFCGSTVLGEPWPPPYVKFQNRCFDSWQDSLDEGSARRKASACAEQRNTERRGQTSMPRAGFEPTISVSKRSRPTPYCHILPYKKNLVTDTIFIVRKCLNRESFVRLAYVRKTSLCKKKKKY